MNFWLNLPGLHQVLLPFLHGFPETPEMETASERHQEPTGCDQESSTFHLQVIMWRCPSVCKCCMICESLRHLAAYIFIQNHEGVLTIYCQGPVENRQFPHIYTRFPIELWPTDKRNEFLVESAGVANISSASHHVTLSQRLACCKSFCEFIQSCNDATELLLTAIGGLTYHPVSWNLNHMFFSSWNEQLIIS